MATDSDAAPKIYAEHGVQAGSSRVHLATFSPTPKTPLASSPLARRSSLGPTHARRLFSPDNSQDSPMESILEDVELTSSPFKPAAHERVAKAPALPSQRPPKHVPGQRVVSLSDHPATGDIKVTQVRVVSMPQRVRPPAKFPPSPAPNGADFSIYSESDLSIARVRMSSRGSETPCTPSPPSSPESVLITMNQDSLPRSFLRKRSGPREQHVRSDNEGWIRWAHSPPRPIPALHGPLSLPYARCPSGAEGTIIEEQDDLPRMIWGLNSDEHIARPPQPQLVNKEHEAFGFSVSPRIQEPPPEKPGPPAQPQFLYQTSLRTPALPDQRAIYRQTPDLDHLRFAYGMKEGGNPRQPNLPPRLASLGHAQHVDFKPAMDFQQVLELDSAAASQTQRDFDFSVFSPPPYAKFGPSPGAPAGALPPIVLGPPTGVHAGLFGLNSHLSTGNNQYRPQVHNFLPTPPSSSSPMWSASFSPQVNSPQLSLHDLANYGQTLRNYSNTVVDHPPHLNRGLNIANVGLEPTYTTGSRIISLGGLQDPAIVSAKPSVHAGYNGLLTPVSPPSPLEPPRPSVPALSPGSPLIPVGRERKRSLSFQAPKSIPLGRLVERRLASVPEVPEDHDLERSRNSPQKRFGVPKSPFMPVRSPSGPGVGAGNGFGARKLRPMSPPADVARMGGPSPSVGPPAGRMHVGGPGAPVNLVRMAPGPRDVGKAVSSALEVDMGEDDKENASSRAATPTEVAKHGKANKSKRRWKKKSSASGATEAPLATVGTA